MNEELDALTDKLLEVSMKLRAAEKELAEVRSQHEKELSKFSHNLKNPVGVTSSFAEMLLGSTSMDEEKQRKYLEIIQSSSKYSLELVNSFQEYNKLQNRSVEFEMKSENYLEVVQEVTSEMSDTLNQRNQSISLNSNCSENLSIQLDRNQFKNALSSILHNALRYSEENTSVTIDVFENETSLITNISDAGIGISEEDLPKLTKTFFTVNTYDVHKQKCIGLGLTKASIIINEMAGTLSFSSELEKGTNVEILLKKV